MHGHAVERTRWPFEVRPLGREIGAELIGVDIAAGVDAAVFRAIHEAFLRYQVLLFGRQDLPPAAQVAFARHFGEVQVHVMNQYHADGHPELYRLSNLDDQGRPNGRHPDRGTLAWHTDGSWRRVTGQATIIYAELVPQSGGETHFCDCYGAYEALPVQMKARIEGLRAVHNLDFSRNRRHAEEPMTAAQRAEVPPVDHPVVRTHPETGRRSLFLGDHAESIQGMPYEDGRELIETLNEMATADPALQYRHRWQQGQLIVWDNRCTMHRATGYDAARERRVIRRCTVLGEVPA